MNTSRTFEFDGLGTHWWIEILDDSPMGDIAAVISARMLQFQSDYSRFDASSYIGRLNHDKRINDPPAELVHMLLFARDMHRATDGIFNISVGSTLGKLGYGTAQSGTHLKSEFWDGVVIDTAHITIPRTSEIDLGGFGKGWLIDQMGELLERRGYDAFIINGGGDILVRSDSPVELALEHPTDPTQRIGTSRITRGALAVSSTKKRVWKKGDTPHHHIIDPRTDASSASAIAATYVRADTALIADVMATVLLIAPDMDDALSAAYDLQTILVSESQLA
jgi:FAD:protein FMN transferase